jgi:C4-type Zn-finger protein
MAFLIFGTHKAVIGIDEIHAPCPSCEADTFQEILVTSNYYHIYHVPVFAFEKEITFVCEKCGLRRKDVPLTTHTVKNYSEINTKFRHPWHTYIFTIVMGSLGLIAILINLFSGKA